MQQTVSSPARCTRVAQFSGHWLLLAGAAIAGGAYAVFELAQIRGTFGDRLLSAQLLKACAAAFFLVCMTGLAWTRYRFYRQPQLAERRLWNSKETAGNAWESRDLQAHALAAVVDGVTRVILQATRDAWREQGQLWSRTVEQTGESQIAALESASQKLLDQIAKLAAIQHDQFQRFLVSVEALRQLSQKSALDFAAKMTALQLAAQQQVELLAQLVGSEGRVTDLQRTLNDNVAALANVEQLDQAIHSLTAAVHLLTVRSGSVGRPGRNPFAPDPNVGEAA